MIWCDLLGEEGGGKGVNSKKKKEKKRIKIASFHIPSSQERRLCRRGVNCVQSARFKRI